MYLYEAIEASSTKLDGVSTAIMKQILMTMASISVKVRQ